MTQITCVQKLRGFRQKLDALRVQTGPSLLKYEGFRRKPICFKGISFFETYFNSRLFFASNMQHSKPHTKISTLYDFICHFSCIYIYFELNDLEIGKGYNLNSEKVETLHRIII